MVLSVEQPQSRRSLSAAGRACMSAVPGMAGYENRHRAYLQRLQERNLVQKQLKEEEELRDADRLKRERGFNVCFSGANAAKSKSNQWQPHFNVRGVTGDWGNQWEEKTVEIKASDGQVVALRPSGERRSSGHNIPEKSLPWRVDTHTYDDRCVASGAPDPLAVISDCSSGAACEIAEDNLCSTILLAPVDDCSCTRLPIDETRNASVEAVDLEDGCKVMHEPDEPLHTSLSTTQQELRDLCADLGSVDFVEDQLCANSETDSRFDDERVNLAQSRCAEHVESLEMSALQVERSPAPETALFEEEESLNMIASPTDSSQKKYRQPTSPRPEPTLPRPEELALRIAKLSKKWQSALLHLLDEAEAEAEAALEEVLPNAADASDMLLKDSLVKSSSCKNCLSQISSPAEENNQTPSQSPLE